MSNERSSAAAANAELVSVIVPCCNQGRFLAQAIESVLAQTWPAIETIVVDDGSTDDTADVARRYAPRVTLVSQANAGPSAARNRGLEAAGGRYVLFLDGDDYLAPTMIETLMRAVTAHPEADVVHGDCQFVTQDGRPLAFRPCANFPPDMFAYLLLGNRMACHTLLVRKAAIVDAGGFDESLRAYEDWDAWLRLADRGGRFVAQTGAVAYYRRYAGTLSQNFERMKASGLLVLDKISQAHPHKSLVLRLRLWRSRFNIRQNTFKGILWPKVKAALGERRFRDAFGLLGRAIAQDWRLVYVAPVAFALLAAETVTAKRGGEVKL